MYSTVQMCLWLTNRRKCFIFGGPSQTNTISAALSFALLCLSSFITVLTSSSSLTLSAKIFSFFSPPPPSHSLQCPPPPLLLLYHHHNIWLTYVWASLPVSLQASAHMQTNTHTHARSLNVKFRSIADQKKKLQISLIPLLTAFISLSESAVVRWLTAEKMRDKASPHYWKTTNLIFPAELLKNASKCQRRERNKKNYSEIDQSQPVWVLNEHPKQAPMRFYVPKIKDSYFL